MRQLFIKILTSLIFTVIASYVCYDTIVGSSFKNTGRISTHLLFDTTKDVNGKYLPIYQFFEENFSRNIPLYLYIYKILKLKMIA